MTTLAEWLVGLFFLLCLALIVVAIAIVGEKVWDGWLRVWDSFADRRRAARATKRP